ncbi:LLM class flavin-dependent oxidoreductase [Paenibacillus sp. 1011MAR3C5]|uniref:LLM class flavin-dependent oxidoreductase n=1 Tax=Paenibacillus sp. 1011MAR3C5 TaxID=1675787 RepID=UPI000E6D14D3|nr:LLM class flavin-dependent oxidoreductase [Paenibacillus sp. 1011MAR3C5]RJE85219.1 LLM class flavin-dependent oxidoreductase [Paenibacillus sp. 1011MAR3C5]
MSNPTKTMEIGMSTFLHANPHNGGVSHSERLRQAMEEIQLADQVGLDVYAIGEHHRIDYTSSSPAVILATAAATTKHIRLSSAVTVLSSDDPVRVYQDFATLDGLSNGRAEIMAGRGSFIESFPLFGYDLNDYEQLFEEKLELLLKIRASEKVTWPGGHRPAIDHMGIYPRAQQEPLPVWIGTGGSPDSAIRAGLLGLPIVFSILGGMPERFAPLVELYKEAAARAGHDPNKLQIATHSHGFISDTTQEAAERYFPVMAAQMNQIGRERGWATYTRTSYDAARDLHGALYVGDHEYVAEKIVLLHKNLGLTRFMMYIDFSSLPHRDLLRTIELLGTKVAPIVHKELASQTSVRNA